MKEFLAMFGLLAFFFGCLMLDSNTVLGIIVGIFGAGLSYITMSEYTW